ncbi:MAG: M14 family metallopeptidase, partial [Leeuwenhoekiella sp.]
MIKIYSLPLLLFFTSLSFAQVEEPTLDYYLPQDVTYDESIPKPQDILGWVPGTWHVSHDKLVNYMNALAEASERITIENRGQTFEGRPLLLLTITSPENHSNLENIRKNHVALTESGSSDLNVSKMPIVTYQGMSIHGNEPSGANAGLIAAYYLAAAQGAKIEEMLNNTVILFDPSFNPDGLQRFAYWANTNKNQNISTDPQDREYDEIWPGGRTNHYWFDMNRDWLPVQLPESQARIKTFHQWYPNILTDHHEMGSSSSFFFQPGIPSRTHPLTPAENQELTRQIGEYHAKAFDSIGSFYYTEEDYDDFYYGKGSTFPDINGSIGILFEQASSRGHAQETSNGVLTFPFTIRNQLNAFLSTLDAAVNLREPILKYQRQFFNNARSEADRGAYIFGSQNDKSTAYALAQLLDRHSIEVYRLDEGFRQDDLNFNTASSFAVPKNQKHSRLLEAMFETRTEFTDSLFYDISAWSFPMAFNLDFVDDASADVLGERVTDFKLPSAQKVEQSSYAYLLPWGDYYAPKALQQILKKGLRAKVSMQPFSLAGKPYDFGTVMIPVQNQELSSAEMQEFLNEVAQNSNIHIDAVTTGLTQGIDLGSRKFVPLEAAKVALLVGERVTSYDAGEIWHLLDTRFDFAITKLDARNLNYTDLSSYTTLILPNGSGNALDKNATDKIKDWVRDGGTLIGYSNVARYFGSNEFMKLDFKSSDNVAKDVSFEQRSDYFGAQVIGGAIFNAKLDRSHPIAFGYADDELHLFRDTTIFIEKDEQSYKNPIVYTEEPLASGYISEENLEQLKGTRPFVHNGLG